VSRTKTTVVLALAGALLIALAVSATSGSGKQSAGDKRGKQSRIRPANAPRAVDPELKAAFGVFRRARTAGDEVAMGRSSGMMVAEHGIALDLARRLPTAPGGSRAWIMPTADGLCLLVRSADSIGPGGTCGTGREVFDQGVITTSTDRDGTEVLGLVPDGVAEARLHFRDGTSEALPIRDNGYYAKSSRATEKVTFTHESRTVSVPAGPQ
jgi:hypothetical protein